MLARLGLVFLLSACAVQPSIVPMHAASTQAEPTPSKPTASARPPRQPAEAPDLAIVYYPALGPMAVAQFRQKPEHYEVEAFRDVRSGLASMWTVTYRGESALKLAQGVERVKRAASLAATCPRRGGRDGSAEPGAFVLWQPGEPNNSSSTSTEPEACLALTVENADWNDRSCSLSLPYVCELD